MIVRECNCDSEAFATPRLEKVNADRTGKDWHGLRVITTTLIGDPEREWPSSVWLAWDTSWGKASSCGCDESSVIPRRPFVRTQEVPRHRRRDCEPDTPATWQAWDAECWPGHNLVNSGFEGSDNQIHTLQAFKNVLTAARHGGKIDMSLPEPQIRGVQAEENPLTAARNAGKIDMSLPKPQIRGL